MAIGTSFSYDTVARTAQVQVLIDSIILTTFSYSDATKLVSLGARVATTMPVADMGSGVASQLSWLSEIIKLFQPPLLKSRTMECKWVKNYSSNRANIEWTIQGADDTFTFTYRKSTGMVTITPRPAFTLPLGDYLRYLRMLETFVQLCNDL